jgi:pimeloyl-ACP methyl ester carboxylesterase
MVGASRGGVYVRLFQAEYPDDVVGLVLIDPTAEDQLFVMFEGRGVALTSLTPDQHRAMQATLPETIPIPSRQPQTGAPFDRLPPALYETRVALDRKLIASMPPTVSAGVAAESGSGDYAMLSRLSAARRANPVLLGDMPLIVLTRGRGSSPDQQAAHAELARMSRLGRHMVVGDAYHEIHLSHPEVVIEAVNGAILQARQRSR